MLHTLLSYARLAAVLATVIGFATLATPHEAHAATLTAPALAAAGPGEVFGDILSIVLGVFRLLGDLLSFVASIFNFVASIVEMAS